MKGDKLTVTGPLGKLQMYIKGVELSFEDGSAQVLPDKNLSEWNARWGLMRSLINNMVTGVSVGFKKVLVIEGREYSVKQVPEGLILNLGFCDPVEFPLPKEIKVEVEERAKKITLSSVDKQLLGQVVADIRKYRPPEPYKGKGIRFENEVIIRKVGKKAAGK